MTPPPGREAVVQGDNALADPADVQRRVIEASHERSERFGLDRHNTPAFDPLSSLELNRLIEQNRTLKQRAEPIMESLYENIINTHSMVVLTDAHGTILHALGDDDFLQRAQKVALAPGVCWSEAAKGTNAIGTALAEEAPTVVHAHDHYLRANHFLTCSATPILDPNGAAVGVLDVTGDFRSYHKHTMALVRMSAQLIENQLFADTFPNAIRVHFHARPEFVGTLMEGLAAFDHEGRFLAANRNAAFQFGLTAKALRTHTFGSLFGISVAQLRDHYRTVNPAPMSVRLANGLIVALRAELARTLAWSMPQFAPSEAAPSPAAAAAQVRADAQSRAPRLSSLRYLSTGDAQMGQVLEKVRKVLGRDIPIMIVGETGTGKELLAQAIHNDSPRAAMPFVAVNCASIPETLIESELFGYEDGAFTGARKRGSQGKIIAANGGTLFLDEIGDMPLALQARLLRVLQERVVTPLGGSKLTPVNVMVVCATNRNLRELIAQNQFREDLYYRLNGLVVKLPPLRDRTDLTAIVHKILQNEVRDGPVPQVAPEVIDAFHRYRWPGNLRQLTNVLRTACVMAGEDHTIRLHDLPDDFLEDLAWPTASASAASDPFADAASVAGASSSDAAVRNEGGRHEAVRNDAGRNEAGRNDSTRNDSTRHDGARHDDTRTEGARYDAPLGASGAPVAPMVPSDGELRSAASVAALASAPASSGYDPLDGRSLEDIERAMIVRALAQHHGNVSAAARSLGISRNTIYRKVPSAQSRHSD